MDDGGTAAARRLSCKHHDFLHPCRSCPLGEAAATAGGMPPARRALPLAQEGASAHSGKRQEGFPPLPPPGRGRRCFMRQWRSGAVTGRRGYPPRLRNGSPRRQVVTLWYPPRTIEYGSRFPGKAAGRGVTADGVLGLLPLSLFRCGLLSRLRPIGRMSIKYFQNVICRLAAGQGAACAAPQGRCAHCE